MKMPSKKIILVGIACVVVIALIFISSQNKNSGVSASAQNPQTEIAPQVIMSETVKNSSNVDTDGDGLKDWEEVLWGTNPEKSDTNGNGIKDAQEVEVLKRSQTLKQAPTASNAFKNSNTAPTQAPTLTEKIAQEAFAKYINLRQTGVKIDEATANQVALSVLSDNNNLETKLQKFTAINIPNTTTTEDSTTIKAYGNEIWNIMVRNTPNNVVLENEYVIFSNSITKNDENELKKLDTIIDGYTATIQDLVVMPVPKSAVPLHLAFLNDMNTVLATIQNMRAYFTDNARGLGALTYYINYVYKLKTSFDSIVSYFDTKGVVYVEGEGGYKLIHSI